MRNQRGLAVAELLISVVLASVLSTSVSLSYKTDINDVLNISIDEKRSLLNEYFESAFKSVELCLSDNLNLSERDDCVNTRTAFSRLAALGVKEDLNAILLDDYLIGNLSRSFTSTFLLDVEVDKNGNITAKEFSSSVGSFLDEMTSLASEHYQNEYINGPGNTQIDFSNLNEFLLGIMLSRVNETATESRLRELNKKLKRCRKECKD